MKYLFTLLFLFLTHGSWSQSLINFQSGKLWGYKNTMDEIKIPAKYKYPANFHNGIALIPEDENDILVVDTTGKTLSTIYNIEFNCGICKHFYSDGLIAAFDTTIERYGFKDINGHWIITPQFYLVEDFHNGLAAVWKYPNIYVDTASDCGTPVTHANWGYININGTYIIPSEHYKPGKWAANELVITDVNGKKSVYNKDGKLISH